MKKLTKKEALTICFRMWDWMARHPDKYVDYSAKHEVCIELGLPKTMASDCAACEYAKQHKKPGKPFCALCPLWPSHTNYFCITRLEPYSRWDWATDCEEREKYARIIADLAKKKLVALEKKAAADKARRSKK